MQNELYQYLAPTLVDQFRYFDTISSTNDYALEWVDAGAPDYSLVIADEQTKGRGRFDRRWITNPGAALAFSLIIKPSVIEQANITLFSPLCGLAVMEAVRETLNIKAEIKWPNDVLINRKKFAGILAEAAWTGESLRGVVLGIGINITPDSVPPADTQLYPATCLETEAARKIDRYQLLREIILGTQRWRAKIGQAEFFDTWQENLAFKGEMVRIEHSEKPTIIGRVKGINSLGNLVLITEDNNEVRFEIGDVHLRPDTTSLLGENHVR